VTARALLIGSGTAAQSARALALIASALSLFGLLIVASVGDAATGSGEPYGYAKKQAVFMVLGLAAALGARAVDYRVLAKAAHGIMGVVWALLVLLLLMPVREQMGAKRWFELPGLGHFQPSEAAKVGLVIWCGAYAAARGPQIRLFWKGALPGLAVVAATAGLVLAQRDLGTTLLLGVVGAVSLVVSGARIGHLAPPIMFGAPVLIIAMSNKFDYIRARLDIYKQGYQSETGRGQVDQALLALGSGGWFGRGFGDSRAHLGFVPQIHNDFVLAAVGEQLGFVGAAGVVVLTLLFFLHGTRVAAAAKDRFGFTLAYGLSFLVALQAAVNLAVATHLVPPKGINLPFVSYGGSSIILLGGCVGLVCSVARVTEREEERERVEEEREAALAAREAEAAAREAETAAAAAEGDEGEEEATEPADAVPSARAAA
jgi:cell division protein FtsW